MLTRISVSWWGAVSHRKKGLGPDPWSVDLTGEPGLCRCSEGRMKADWVRVGPWPRDWGPYERKAGGGGWIRRHRITGGRRPCQDGALGGSDAATSPWTPRVPATSRGRARPGGFPGVFSGCGALRVDERPRASRTVKGRTLAVLSHHLRGHLLRQL